STTAACQATTRATRSSASSSRARASATTSGSDAGRADSMTIKWVKSDPLVMNGEPFCYGTRLTVRNLLEMRANGLTPAEMMTRSPELKRVGIAEAFRFASENKARYGDFFEND